MKVNPGLVGMSQFFTSTEGDDNLIYSSSPSRSMYFEEAGETV